MTRRVLIVFLALCAPASAATQHYKNFHSPSKQIRCFLLKYGGKGYECSAPYLPRYATEGDSYLHVEPHGKAEKGSRGDYPGYSNVKDHTLKYGDVNARRGVRCTSKASGLTCRNLDGHGFHMAKGDVYLF